MSNKDHYFILNTIIIMTITSFHSMCPRTLLNKVVSILIFKFYYFMCFKLRYKIICLVMTLKFEKSK